MTVQGDGQIIRNPGTGDATCSNSARFTVRAGTQTFSTVDAIRWDLLSGGDTWDDIGFAIGSGFDSGYNTTGEFVFPAASNGEYTGFAYARLVPTGTVGVGTAEIVISCGFVTVNEEMSAPLSDVGPKLIVPFAHRFAVATLFEVDCHAFGNGSDMRIDEAVIYIEKRCPVNVIEGGT